MKLKSDKFWVPWVLFCGMGFILAFVLSYIISILKMGLQLEYVQVLDILLGIFIICGIGLMIVEKSRFIGLLIVAISVPSLLYFAFIEVKVLLYYLAIGFCIGIGITVFFTYKIRFDWLAKTLKYLVDLFLIIGLGYTAAKMWENSTLITKEGTWPYFIIAILMAIGLWYFFTRNLFAITSSDVFVFGPTGSGKSVFIAALGIEIAKSQGFSKSYIFSQERDAPSRLSVVAMAERLKRGHQIEPTRMNEMAYYEFPAKKWGIIPLKVTSLDYAGGHVAKQNIDKISKNNYNAQIQYFSHILNRVPTELKTEFGDIQFLWNFRNNHEQDFFSNFELIVPAFAYARLLKAGKIIFLLDGSKIQSEKTDDEEWIAYVEGISRIIDELGEDKDYAFAVTKSDIISSIGNQDPLTSDKTPTLNNNPLTIGDNVRTYPQDSKRADRLEKQYFEEFFRSDLAFTNILNTIMGEQFITTKYIEGFMISVDISAKGESITGYHPWRMNKIIDYVFKF